MAKSRQQSQDIYLLNVCLYLREEVNKLNIGGQHELTGCKTAQMKLGMKQLELN